MDDISKLTAFHEVEACYTLNVGTPESNPSGSYNLVRSRFYIPDPQSIEPQRIVEFREVWSYSPLRPGKMNYEGTLSQSIKPITIEETEQRAAALLRHDPNQIWGKPLYLPIEKETTGFKKVSTREKSYDANGELMYSKEGFDRRGGSFALGQMIDRFAEHSWLGAEGRYYGDDYSRQVERITEKGNRLYQEYLREAESELRTIEMQEEWTPGEGPAYGL